jgi:hypothetical protein
LPFDALQKARKRLPTGIRREAYHAVLAGIDVNAVRLYENRVAAADVE